MIRLTLPAAPLGLLTAAPTGQIQPGRWTLTVHPYPIRPAKRVF